MGINGRNFGLAQLVQLPHFHRNGSANLETLQPDPHAYSPSPGTAQTQFPPPRDGDALKLLATYRVLEPPPRSSPPPQFLPLTPSPQPQGQQAQLPLNSLRPPPAMAQGPLLTEPHTPQAAGSNATAAPKRAREPHGRTLTGKSDPQKILILNDRINKYKHKVDMRRAERDVIYADAAALPKDKESASYKLYGAQKRLTDCENRLAAIERGLTAENLTQNMESQL
jgi:hypothetical protein